MPNIEEYNSDEIRIKRIYEQDLTSDDYLSLANSYNTVYGFVENSNLFVIKILDKEGNPIHKIGEWGQPGYFDLPSCGEETVALLIEDDTMEGIMDFAEQIVWYSPEELHWYRINGKLICELWWD